jgi:hypothetical protein
VWGGGAFLRVGGGAFLRVGGGAFLRVGGGAFLRVGGGAWNAYSLAILVVVIVCLSYISMNPSPLLLLSSSLI